MTKPVAKLEQFGDNRVTITMIFETKEEATAWYDRMKAEMDQGLLAIALQVSPATSH